MDELAVIIAFVACISICLIVCCTSYNLAELSIKHAENRCIVNQVKDKP